MTVKSGRSASGTTSPSGAPSPANRPISSRAESASIRVRAPLGGCDALAIIAKPSTQHRQFDFHVTNVFGRHADQGGDRTELGVTPRGAFIGR